MSISLYNLAIFGVGVWMGAAVAIVVMAVLRTAADRPEDADDGDHD